ncbi:DUF2213 domain-containing protein [Telmatospirillum sp. J64-1]|uniref:DUF2213 domain-containing protein n=1 Tax=Telmatospirillum sp. J64-1 TaxID=2502183 RepID=UPI00163D82BE|nr:DUF2213 domain-containing protein [Telmatospirillum sp. J64-1]
MARFLVAAELSDRQHETPEGFLLCRDVAIARTGYLEYLPEEVPITPAEGATITTVYRLAEDLFAPAALASFEGKPFVLGHPEEGVRPDNWRDLACGHLQNVRRGVGPESDLMLADILVTDAAAIAAIRKDGLREVSCGYDAEYQEIAPGVGRQSNIRGNHVALVEAGRCGPRCAIKDEDSMKKAKRSLLGMILGNPKLKSTIDADPKVRQALDEAIAEEVKDQEQQEPPQPITDEEESQRDEARRVGDELGEIKLLLRSVLEKLDGGTGDSEPEEGAATDAEPETLDEGQPETEQKTSDRRPVARAARVADAAILRDAAILAPSLAVAIGDEAPLVKRMALRAAMKDAAINRVVTAALAGGTLDTARGAVLDGAFAAAVEVARARANTRTADALAGGGRPPAPVRDHDTPAGLNKLFAEHRKKG